jgi:hypothetical protein
VTTESIPVVSSEAAKHAVKCQRAGVDGIAWLREIAPRLIRINPASFWAV